MNGLSDLLHLHTHAALPRLSWVVAIFQTMSCVVFSAADSSQWLVVYDHDASSVCGMVATFLSVVGGQFLSCAAQRRIPAAGAV